MDHSAKLKKENSFFTPGIFYGKIWEKIPINSKTIPLGLSDVRIKNVDSKGINDKLSPVYQTGINLRSI